MLIVIFSEVPNWVLVTGFILLGALIFAAILTFVIFKTKGIINRFARKLSVNFPEKFNLGNAWILGLLVDVTMGNLLGQNALALCVISYISVKFHLQFRVFPILQMSSIVFLLVGIHQFILFWINGVVGDEVIFIKYFVPILTSTLMWPLVVILLGKFKHVLQE